jgi:hypothetical protein
VGGNRVAGECAPTVELLNLYHQAGDSTILCMASLETEEDRRGGRHTLVVTGAVSVMLDEVHVMIEA